MPIRNQNWYDLQATRRYPLDENSTGVDDAGAFIRDSIVVDCHIRFPETLGLYTYIQGITITPKLITIIFGVGNHPEDTAGPSIAALAIQRSAATQNVNLDLSPLQAGVAGWVVLGAGITEDFVGRYTTPQQTLISPRCARAYRPLPIPSIGKLNMATSLQNIVTLAAQSPLTAKAEKHVIAGKEVDAIVFRLEGEDQTFNPLQFFQGPCAQRPESGTCPKPALETINGVAPDCDGNINIVFDGFDAYPYVNCGGVDVISNLGLSAACAAGEPKSRRVIQDKCYPAQSLSAGDDQYWSPPLPSPRPPVIIVSESLPAENWPITCATVPICLDFSAGAAPDFITKKGLFVFTPQQAPAQCGAEVNEGDSSLALQEHFTYAAADIVGANISLFKNCASDWALDKTISVEMRATTNGLQRNGGVVFNYLRGNPALRIPTTYMAATVDFTRGSVCLLRWNGARLVTEYAAPFLLYVDKWYRLAVRSAAVNSTVIVTVTAQALEAGAAAVSFTVPIPAAAYGDPTGQAGLFSDRAYTFFNKFRIEE